VSHEGHDALRNIAKEFSEADKVATQTIDIDRRHDVGNIERFCESSCNLLYHQRAAKNQIKLVKESRR